MQVLIVEGDVALRGQVATALMPVGFDVLAFACPDPAKEAARRNRVDVLVLGCDGEEGGALALLAEWRNPRLATILLSDRQGDALDDAFARLPSLQAVLGRRPEARTLAQIALSAARSAGATVTLAEPVTAHPAQAGATILPFIGAEPVCLLGVEGRPAAVPVFKTELPDLDPDAEPAPTHADLPLAPAIVPMELPESGVQAAPTLSLATDKDFATVHLPEAPVVAGLVAPVVDVPSSALTSSEATARSEEGDAHASQAAVTAPEPATAPSNRAAGPALAEETSAPDAPSVQAVGKSAPPTSEPAAALSFVRERSATSVPTPETAPPRDEAPLRPERRLRLSMDAPARASISAPIRAQLPSFAEPAPTPSVPPASTSAILTAAETRALLAELARRYSRLAGEAAAAPRSPEAAAPGPLVLQHG